MAEQGQTYADFIGTELEREHDRRDNLDARGLSVVTSSAALLTLVVSLSVLVLGKDFTVTGVSAWAVAVSLALFVAAGVSGIVANFARGYEVTDEHTLQAMLGKGHWKDDEIDARNVCAALNIATICALRTGNNSKANALTWALSFQVAAIAALGVAFGRELFRLI